MKNFLKRFLIAFTLILTSFANAQTAGAGVEIDGQPYSTVIINGREWMAENLNATEYEDGTPFVSKSVTGLLNAPTTLDISNGPYFQPAYVTPTGGSGNYKGLLYNYNAVAIYDVNGASQGERIIKTGWHVPSLTEWNEMIAFTNAGTTDNMRKVNSSNAPFTTYWNITNCGGNFVDQYNFGAVASGRVNVVNSSNTSEMQFSDTGSFFWVTSAGTGDMPYVKIFCNGGQFINMSTGNINRRSALSIRLIKDTPLSTNTFNKSKVSIYPNPVKDELNIETQYNVELVQVFDLTGKNVLTFKEMLNVNVSQLTKGVYILKVTTDNGILTQKLVKN